MFLERDPFLHELEAARTGAVAGHGCAVFVGGEAGIGKTTLLERFVARVEAIDDRARVFWGSCDALYTPRPLGPLLDMARQARGTLEELVRGGADRERLFTGMLDELSRAMPHTVAVFEDVHWADEATLDLLKFLVRRIGRTPGLLVLTFRDDEVDAAHPLRGLLGELPARAARRLTLPPLSAAAVARMAKAAGRVADGLRDITGGNPFYITEVLATKGGVTPASVRDAVLARASRLSPEARAVLDVVSVVPGRTERATLERVLQPAASAMQEGVRAGILVGTHDALAFRHELARRAWEDALEPAHAAALHARMLRALEDDGTTPLARVVHHADRAGDAATVLRLAPAAAREAAALGAHREAAAQCERALRHAARAAPAERAALLDAWSYEVHLSGRTADAARARVEALALWREAGDPLREGDALRHLSRLRWLEGRREEAAECADAAIRTLEPLGPSHELAMAYGSRAQLHILEEERQLAAALGDRAVAMAEALGDPEALVHALINAACLEPGGARAQQVRAARLAQEHGLHEHAMRAFTWLVTDAIADQDYALAEQFIDEAIAYADARDMDGSAFYLRGWRARMRVEQGRLDEAEAEAADIVRQEDVSTVVRLPALAALGTVRVRRGVDASAILDEALALALATGELQRIAPVANARAEAAWLRGDLAGVRVEAMRAYPMALRAGSRWDAARLAAWLRRAGALEALEALAALPDEVPGPFAAELAGRWREAAHAWQALGCPYERALALAEGGEDAQRAALEILGGLGARPAAAIVRERLRRHGVRGLPRGPRPGTRANPAGLTDRQLDVLALLGEALSNREIAERLSVSTRTVDHHVSAILRKLGTDSRARAAIVARDIARSPGASVRARPSGAAAAR